MKKLLLLISVLFFLLFSCKKNNELEVHEQFICDRDTLVSEIRSIIHPMIEKIPETVILQFDSLFLIWDKSEITSLSSYEMIFACNQEYYCLFDFCKPYGKLMWPLIMDQIIVGLTGEKNCPDCPRIPCICEYKPYNVLLFNLAEPLYGLSFFRSTRNLSCPHNHKWGDEIIIYVYLILQRESKNIWQFIEIYG